MRIVIKKLLGGKMLFVDSLQNTTHFHGTSIKENHQKLRQRVLEKVKSIYDENCQLAPQYQAINTIPLENRQRQTTQIEHQKSMTLYLDENKFTQLTIQEAF